MKAITFDEAVEVMADVSFRGRHRPNPNADCAQAIYRNVRDFILDTKGDEGLACAHEVALECACIWARGCLKDALHSSTTFEAWKASRQ